MVISCDIFKSIHSSQLRNGMRYNDFSRYRRYCTRKLHRLRKATGLTHGRKRFKLCSVPELTKDVKVIEMLLFAAERVWSYGIELKLMHAACDSAKGSLRHSYVRKLSRAVKCADALVEVSKTSCCERTVKEATAYCMWLSGLYRVERGRFEMAHADLLHSRDILLNMGDSVDEVTREIFLLKIRKDYSPLFRLIQHYTGLETQNVGMSNEDTSEILMDEKQSSHGRKPACLLSSEKKVWSKDELELKEKKLLEFFLSRRVRMSSNGRKFPRIYLPMAKILEGCEVTRGSGKISENFFLSLIFHRKFEENQEAFNRLSFLLANLGEGENALLKKVVLKYRLFIGTVLLLTNARKPMKVQEDKRNEEQFFSDKEEEEELEEAVTPVLQSPLVDKETSEKGFFSRVTGWLRK